VDERKGLDVEEEEDSATSRRLSVSAVLAGIVGPGTDVVEVEEEGEVVTVLPAPLASGRRRRLVR
jgi:hypothetical protein